MGSCGLFAHFSVSRKAEKCNGLGMDVPLLASVPLLTGSQSMVPIDFGRRVNSGSALPFLPKTWYTDCACYTNA